MTTFHAVRDNAATTLAQPRPPGAASITVADGSRFPAEGPYRITLASPLAGDDPANLCVFRVTGRAGNVLSGLSVAEGSTDRAFLAGDLVEMRWTAAAAGDIHGAVNAL